jgi:putative salt-induced outer membrane protein
MRKTALAAALVLSSANVLAQDEAEATDGWAGKGEFGFVKTSGNTDNETLNFALEFTKESELWKHRFFAAALTSSKDGVDDAERYQMEFQSDRKLSELSYLFGVVRWDSDKFGAYDPATSIAFGYGRKLINTDRHTLSGEVGVGYRSLEDRITGDSSSEAIFRLLLDDTFVITDNTEWVNRLLVESGSDNTFTQFNTGLSVAMSSAFAVKLGFEYRHNSDIPVSVKDKTDTMTTVNLVYNF